MKILAQGAKKQCMRSQHSMLTMLSGSRQECFSRNFLGCETHYLEAGCNYQAWPNTSAAGSGTLLWPIPHQRWPFITSDCYLADLGVHNILPLHLAETINLANLVTTSKQLKKSQERNKFFQMKSQKSNKCIEAQLEIKICSYCFLNFILGIRSDNLIAFLLPDELKFNSVPLEALIQNKLLASAASHLNYILREEEFGAPGINIQFSWQHFVFISKFYISGQNA